MLKSPGNSPVTETNKEWNEINQWLQSLNYVSYAPLFKNAGYDLWEIVLDLKSEDLIEICIKPGHAKRIEKQLAFKKKGNTSTTRKLQPISHNIKQEIIFAEKMKNQLFQTMSRVLNGLQQQLIEMNVKFAEPILLLQRTIQAEKTKDHMNSVTDAMLFETLRRSISELKSTNDRLWGSVNEFRNLADSQLNDATEQIMQQMNVVNPQRNNKHNNTNNVLNTIVVNLDEPNYKLAVLPQYNSNNNNINISKFNPTTIVNVSTMRDNKNASSIPPYSMNEIEMMKDSANKHKQGGRFDIIQLQNKMQSVSGYIRNPIDIVHKMQSMGLFNTINTTQTVNNNNNNNNESAQKQSSMSLKRRIVPPPPSSSASPNGKRTIEYQTKEILYIRKLIGEYPNANTKELFAKFRQQFHCWADDKESYNLFYQSVWKLCEELIHRKQGPAANLNQDLNCNEPQRKKRKLHHNVPNILPLRQ